ncbi:MAG: DNA-binding domain-containing protein [Alphaproteobacteria bacterium]|nr:DNA-binding domain-containing protein [Alphaproteobacteria bacterium]
MRLNEFQKTFTTLMLDEPGALNAPPSAFVALLDDGDIPLSRRLLVYRNNIVGGLTEVMRESFPLLEKLVGREFLEGMARGFILKNPPTQGCLNFYGHGFAEFIEAYAPAGGLPYLPDVARLEIALSDSYYAEETPALTAEGLAAIPPETLADVKLPLAPHVRLLASRYPLMALKTFCDDPQAAAPDMAEGSFLMVSRPHESVDMYELTESGYVFLRALAEEASLGEALEQALACDPAFNVAEHLQKHIALETFSALLPNK